MILPPMADFAVGGFLCEKTEKPDQWISLHLFAVLIHSKAELGAGASSEL